MVDGALGACDADEGCHCREAPKHPREARSHNAVSGVHQHCIHCVLFSGCQIVRAALDPFWGDMKLGKDG